MNNFIVCVVECGAVGRGPGDVGRRLLSGMNYCRFLTRPFRYSFTDHLFVKRLKGRLLGTTSFRDGSHNCKVGCLVPQRGA